MKVFRSVRDLSPIAIRFLHFLWFGNLNHIVSSIPVYKQSHSITKSSKVMLEAASIAHSDVLLDHSSMSCLMDAEVP